MSNEKNLTKKRKYYTTKSLLKNLSYASRREFLTKIKNQLQALNLANNEVQCAFKQMNSTCCVLMEKLPESHRSRPSKSRRSSYQRKNHGSNNHHSQGEDPLRKNITRSSSKSNFHSEEAPSVRSLKSVSSSQKGRVSESRNCSEIKSSNHLMPNFFQRKESNFFTFSPSLADLYPDTSSNLKFQEINSNEKYLPKKNTGPFPNRKNPSSCAEKFPNNSLTSRNFDNPEEMETASQRNSSKRSTHNNNFHNSRSIFISAKKENKSEGRSFECFRRDDNFKNSPKRLKVDSHDSGVYLNEHYLPDSSTNSEDDVEIIEEKSKETKNLSSGIKKNLTQNAYDDMNIQRNINEIDDQNGIRILEIDEVPFVETRKQNTTKTDKIGSRSDEIRLEMEKIAQTTEQVGCSNWIMSQRPAEQVTDFNISNLLPPGTALQNLQQKDLFRFAWQQRHIFEESKAKNHQAEISGYQALIGEMFRILVQEMPKLKNQEEEKSSKPEELKCKKEDEVALLNEKEVNDNKEDDIKDRNFTLNLEIPKNIETVDLDSDTETIPYVESSYQNLEDSDVNSKPVVENPKAQNSDAIAENSKTIPKEIETVDLDSDSESNPGNSAELEKAETFIFDYDPDIENVKKIFQSLTSSDLNIENSQVFKKIVLKVAEIIKDADTVENSNPSGKNTIESSQKVFENFEAFDLDFDSDSDSDSETIILEFDADTVVENSKTENKNTENPDQLMKTVKSELIVENLKNVDSKIVKNSNTVPEEFETIDLDSDSDHENSHPVVEHSNPSVKSEPIVESSKNIVENSNGILKNCQQIETIDLDSDSEIGNSRELVNSNSEIVDSSGEIFNFSSTVVKPIEEVDKIVEPTDKIDKIIQPICPIDKAVEPTSPIERFEEQPFRTIGKIVKPTDINDKIVQVANSFAQFSNTNVNLIKEIDNSSNPIVNSTSSIDDSPISLVSSSTISSVATKPLSDSSVSSILTVTPSISSISTVTCSPEEISSASAVPSSASASVLTSVTSSISSVICSPEEISSASAVPSSVSSASASVLTSVTSSISSVTCSPEEISSASAVPSSVSTTASASVLKSETSSIFSISTVTCSTEEISSASAVPSSVSTTASFSQSVKAENISDSVIASKTAKLAAATNNFKGETRKEKRLTDAVKARRARRREKLKIKKREAKAAKIAYYIGLAVGGTNFGLTKKLNELKITKILESDAKVPVPVHKIKKENGEKEVAASELIKSTLVIKNEPEETPAKEIKTPEETFKKSGEMITAPVSRTEIPEENKKTPGAATEIITEKSNLVIKKEPTETTETVVEKIKTPETTIKIPKENIETPGATTEILAEKSTVVVKKEPVETTETIVEKGKTPTAATTKTIEAEFSKKEMQTSDIDEILDYLETKFCKKAEQN